MAWGGTLGTYTGPSGFTVATPGAAINARGGYKGPGTYTDENASQTTGTARNSVGAVASFKSASAGGFQAAWARGANIVIGAGAR